MPATFHAPPDGRLGWTGVGGEEEVVVVVVCSPLSLSSSSFPLVRLSVPPILHRLLSATRAQPSRLYSSQLAHTPHAPPSSSTTHPLGLSATTHILRHTSHIPCSSLTPGLPYLRCTTITTHRVLRPIIHTPWYFVRWPSPVFFNQALALACPMDACLPAAASLQLLARRATLAATSASPEPRR